MQTKRLPSDLDSAGPIESACLVPFLTCVRVIVTISRVIVTLSVILARTIVRLYVGPVASVIAADVCLCGNFGRKECNGAKNGNATNDD